MTDFFTEMAGVATDLLTPSDQGGLGATNVVYVRYTAVAPADPWLPPPAPTRVELPIRAQVFGVGKELIGAPVDNGGAIVMGDRYVITPSIPGGYELTDVIEIDGVPVTVLAIKRIPEAGTISAIRFIVRG